METAAKVLPATASDPCRFLSKREVLALVKISESALFSLAHRKQNPLPSVKLGKSRRYPYDKVRLWMENLEK